MQPTIVKTSKQELCLVEVPDDAEYFHTFSISPFAPIELGINCSDDYTFSVTLPEGNWQLIAPLKDITEEQEGELGETIESLNSLVASTGLKGNVVLLKKI